MGFENIADIEAATAGLLRWWHDAGVDTAISETPNDWLGTVPKIAKPGSEGKIDTATLADRRFETIDILVEYLNTGPLPDAGPPHRRLPPAGDPNTDLMILVDFPDVADIDRGHLLSDPVFDKMLDAIGRDRASVYIAPLCPGRPLTGRLPSESVGELAVLAKKHIGFVAPKQLWLMGSASSRAILGIDDAVAKGKLHHVNHGGATIETIATAHPRMFDGSKARKAAAWAEMQRLILRDDA